MRQGLKKGQSRITKAIRIWCLLAGLGILPTICAASEELFVGNFFGHDSDILLFNGSTGAFESVFVPFTPGVMTFPLGAAFASDGSFLATNSDTDAVQRFNGTTGAFISTFASNVEDAAGMKFGPDGNLYVVSSSDPGAVTELNGTTGAFIKKLTVPSPPA